MNKAMIFCAGILIPLVSNSATQPPFKEKPAKEIKLEKPAEHVLTSKVPVTDIIIYSEISCSPGQLDSCSHSRKLEAPEGTQACRLLYTVVSQNGHNGVRSNPTNWYANDPQNPDRFKAYDVTIFAQGGGVGGAGANIKVINIGIRVIPASAVNSDRYDAGCDMPTH